jgi:hypothetical protein
MPQLDPVPVGVALDSAGAIESGALLYVYTAGTTTPVTTYQNAALTTEHARPVEADSSGRFAEVYVPAGNYKLDLQDAEGSSLPGYPRDNISLTASGVTTGATYGRAIQLSDDYSDTDAWTIESSVGITARAQGYDSTTELFDDPYVLEFAGDASDATNKVESAASVATVTPGQELRVTAPIYATGSPTSTFEVGLEWYTSAGATISEAVSSYANGDITTGQVLHASKLATAPATAAGVRVIGQRKTANVTGNWYMGAARLEIGVDGGFVTLAGTETLTNKTLTAPVLNGSLTGTGILDEDDMSSDSATAVPTQQSVKAYVDNQGWTYLSSQATTSGTEVDFTVPTSAREIVVGLVGVSLSGADNVLIQLGDGGGIETSGYNGGVGNSSVEVISTSGFAVQAGADARLEYGVVHLNDLNNDGTVWGCLIAHENNGASVVNSGGGTKTLSAAITTVRITRSGTDTFDAGAAYCKYR